MLNSIMSRAEEKRIKKYLKEAYPNGKLPKKILKEGWWASEKERDEFFEKKVKKQLQKMNGK